MKVVLLIIIVLIGAYGWWDLLFNKKGKSKMKQTIIKKGRVYGYRYFIVENNITSTTPTINYDAKWYCSYVAVPRYKRKQLDVNSLEVHGGITYEGYLPFIDKGLTYLYGWDYNHYNDVVMTDKPEDFMKTKLQLKTEEDRIDILYGDVVKFIKENLL